MKIPINPKLPAGFESTPNDERPKSHQRWWHRPFIVTFTWEQMHRGAKVSDEQMATWRTDWFASWPSGTRYDVRCLDGGAWDRSTCWGMFPTEEAAVAFARLRARP